MVRKIALAPFRLMLGLPPVYGITIGNRVLQIGRWLGLYRGPIHFVATVPTVQFRGVGTAIGG